MARYLWVGLEAIHAIRVEPSAEERSRDNKATGTEQGVCEYDPLIRRG
jgi:hypothetical protein